MSGIDNCEVLWRAGGDDIVKVTYSDGHKTTGAMSSLDRRTREDVNDWFEYQHALLLAALPTELFTLSRESAKQHLVLSGL